MSGPLRVLVANEPRSYREVYAEALRGLRPEVEVRVALPGDVDRWIDLFHPHLVLCSDLTPKIEREVPAWIQFYPPEEPAMLVFTQGEVSTMAPAELETLLSVVDRSKEFLNDLGQPWSL